MMFSPRVQPSLSTLRQHSDCSGLFFVTPQKPQWDAQRTESTVATSYTGETILTSPIVICARTYAPSPARSCSPSSIRSAHNVSKARFCNSDVRSMQQNQSMEMRYTTPLYSSSESHARAAAKKPPSTNKDTSRSHSIIAALQDQCSWLREQLHYIHQLYVLAVTKNISLSSRLNKTINQLNQYSEQYSSVLDTNRALTDEVDELKDIIAYLGQTTSTESDTSTQRSSRRSSTGREHDLQTQRLAGAIRALEHELSDTERTCAWQLDACNDHAQEEILRVRLACQADLARCWQEKLELALELREARRAGYTGGNVDLPDAHLSVMGL